MKRLEAVFGLTRDLLDALSDEDVNRSLSQPSNTIWDQLWCVVGARESHAKAIEAGEWGGFSCSLTTADRGSKERLQVALEASRRAVVDAVAAASDRSDEIVLDLLLHETQHHGQLIRYFYGLELDFPESWRRRWNLTW